MNKRELKERVGKIIETGAWDDESAHYEEDGLHMELIKEFCPEWVKVEIERLSNATFARWYA